MSLLPPSEHFIGHLKKEPIEEQDKNEDSVKSQDLATDPTKLNPSQALIQGKRQLAPDLPEIFASDYQNFSNI